MEGCRIYRIRHTISVRIVVNLQPPDSFSGGCSLLKPTEGEETMTTKSILFAILATLPFVARAENISGAMYIAPSVADNNHPAPTTNANAPYGRVNIDVADQDHIATTAYVKGAYNSAIAAVNTSIDEAVSETIRVLEQQGLYDKQDKLLNADGDEILQDVTSGSQIDSEIGNSLVNLYDDDEYEAFRDDIINGYGFEPDTSLMTAGAIFDTIHYVNKHLVDAIGEKRVTIYTTWDDDSANATTQVSLTSAN